MGEEVNYVVAGNGADDAVTQDVIGGIRLAMTREKSLARERDEAIVERDAALREGENWQTSAAQAHRNQLYYAGLVDEIGSLLGPAAMTQDDGNFTGEVLRAKVAEVLAATLAAKDRDLIEARRETAIGRSSLAASWEREKMLDATIRELRRELLECRDAIATIAKVEPPGPIADWLRDFSGDRRRLGA